MRLAHALLVALLAFAAVKADDFNNCYDLELNGNETRVDCGGDECMACEDRDPGVGPQDMSISDNHLTGGVVGPIGGLVISGSILGVVLPKNGIASPGSEAIASLVFTGIASTFLIFGTTTNVWNSWHRVIPGLESYHYVASPFALCEDDLIGSCVYVHDDCKLYDNQDRRIDSPYPVTSCNDLRVVRSLAIIASISAVIAYFALFWSAARWGAKYVSVFFSFVAALFGLIVMAVWASYVDNRDGWFQTYSDEDTLSEWHYDYSFYLFIVGWVFASIGTIISVFIPAVPCEHCHNSKCGTDCKTTYSNPNTTSGDTASGTAPRAAV